MRTETILAAAFIFGTAGIFILVGLFDLIQLSHDSPQNTVSMVVRRWAEKHPMLPFTFGIVVGLVIGHIFW